MTTLAANRPSSAMTALRTVIVAGTWANGLLALACVLAIVLPWLGIGEEKAIGLGAVLAAILVMFWAMLGGSRLIALSVQATQLRLPRVAGQNLRHAAAALLLAVVAPALALTVLGSHSLPLNLAVLGIGLLIGLFWASIPPWLIFVLMAVGYVPYWLLPIAQRMLPPTALDGLSHWLMRWLDSPWALEQGLGLALLVLLIANACCWWNMARRQLPAQGWSTPLALAFANGMQATTARTQQAQYSSALFTQDTPIGHDLHRQPEQALGIALGPGFGRTTFKSVLGSQGPILAVSLLWLLLAQGSKSGVGVALFFAPLLAISPALAPLMRLQTLFKLPGMGLHELALLPGLPRPAAPALAMLLMRQTLLRMLPALAIMAATGFLMEAERPFHSLLLWSSCGSLLLLQGLSLLALHDHVFRWALGISAIVLTVAIFASMLAGLRAGPPAWLLPAWQAACVLGALLAGFAHARLRALPHPWLAN